MIKKEIVLKITAEKNKIDEITIWLDQIKKENKIETFDLLQEKTTAVID